MPELDSLRGIAVLGVLFHHGFKRDLVSGTMPTLAAVVMKMANFGWLGVNLFFVLSGFLITGILVATRDRGDYYRRFYIRRALRILPLYYAVLIVLGITGIASLSFLGLATIYLANVTAFFGVVNPYGVLWSLAVEEHFYLFWPTAARRLSIRTLVGIALALLISMPIARAVAFYWFHTEGINSYTWLVADGLAVGALLALFLQTETDRRKIARAAKLAMAFSLLFFLLGVPLGITTRESLFGAAFQFTPFNIFFAGTMLAVLLIGSTERKKWVLSPVLQFFGAISYGLYLLHMLFFIGYDHFIGLVAPGLADFQHHFGLLCLRFAVAGSAAILVAWLSRWYFEEPFLKLKTRLAA